MKKYIPYLVGILVFGFILTRADLSRTVEILLSANPLFLFLALFIILPLLLLEAYRWHVILGFLGIKQGFLDSFSMFASSLYIGFVTPARLGEFVRVAFTRKQGLGKSFASVFFDRLADLGFILVAGYLGMFLFETALEQQIIWFSIAFLALSVLLCLAILRRDIFRLVLRAVFHRIVPDKMKDDVKSAFYDFYRGFLVLVAPKKVFVIVSITIASWVLYYFQVFFLAMSLGIEISFFHLATIISVAGVLSVLPISISGIGTRDAAFVLFFGLLGIGSEFAIALSALVLLLILITALVCLPFWLRRPADISLFTGE